jgi:hypothetical protein
VGDDNPLWYDYAEPEEPPGRMPRTLGGLFSLAMRATTASARLCRATRRRVSSAATSRRPGGVW